MKSGATNPKKENAFCREPTLSEPPLACSASQGLADHPIGLSTAPALATFRTLRIHCPLTYYPTHAYIIRDQRSHATLAKTGRLNGCFSLDSRAHTHTRISFRPFLIDATRDANTNRVKRKRKLRRDHLAHVPRHVFHARVWIRPRARRPAFSISSFFTNYSGTGN